MEVFRCKIAQPVDRRPVNRINWIRAKRSESVTIDIHFALAIPSRAAELELTGARAANPLIPTPPLSRFMSSRTKRLS